MAIIAHSKNIALERKVRKANPGLGLHPWASNHRPPPAVKTPSNFIEDTELPEVDTWLLASLHPHWRDQHVKFVSSSHTYYIDGLQTLGSVTGLIHEFAQEP